MRGGVQRMPQGQEACKGGPYRPLQVSWQGDSRCQAGALAQRQDHLRRLHVRAGSL